MDRVRESDRNGPDKGSCRFSLRLNPLTQTEPAVCAAFLERLRITLSCGIAG